MSRPVTNVIVAGLGGQGVLKASDMLADAVFRAGYEVKKSEIHGMAQRGGSVTSDVRFGDAVFSPMVPTGTADFLVVLEADQVEPNRHLLKEGGVLLTPDTVDASALANRKSLNVALLGALSTYLEVEDACWLAAVRSLLAAKLHAANEQAFAAGQAAVRRA